MAHTRGDDVAADEPESCDLARQVGATLESLGLTIATAESCTGGLIGCRLTDVPGSSAYYLGGVVAYANAAKSTLLGVSADSIASLGAVSAEVSVQMAEGVRARLRADLAVGVTGIAGPGGGSPGKPVGLVYIAVASSQATEPRRYLFGGDRSAIREAAAVAALRAVLAAAPDPS